MSAPGTGNRWHREAVQQSTWDRLGAQYALAERSAPDPVGGSVAQKVGCAGFLKLADTLADKSKDIGQVPQGGEGGELVYPKPSCFR